MQTLISQLVLKVRLLAAAVRSRLSSLVDRLTSALKRRL